MNKTDSVTDRTSEMPTQSVTTAPKPTPRSSNPGALAEEIIEHLAYRIGKDATVAKPHDWLKAAILVIRDRVIDHWMDSTRRTYAAGAKRVYYLSMEFLIGRLMRDAVSNLGLLDNITAALNLLGVDLDTIAELEPDAALGNGGLGRLAACFMESMATVDIPAFGYGIRYINGMFRQEMSDGAQVELPETWLAHGNPWEFERRESAYEVGFGGTVEVVQNADGTSKWVWKPAERVIASAYDTPVVGWRARRVNTLRLWSAQPVDPILLAAFNAGDHVGALRESIRADALERVLYPADATEAGQELRFRQEYFFTSASLQDILRRHLHQYKELRSLPEKTAIQLNDTHPAIAIAELMRLLIDIHRFDFDTAWDITRRTVSYTNHTLLPEALESWSVGLFEHVLPRHLQMVYSINGRLLVEAQLSNGATDEQIRNISLITEGSNKYVRMGNLAFAGSHSVNGVSTLHTELMRQTVFRDLHRIYPGRINSKTNGITPRRWLMQCNPALTDLLRETIGDRFMDDAEALEDLNAFAGDVALQERFAAVKEANKERLAAMIADHWSIHVDPSALFDIQIKRIHEYKRQLMNIIEAVALYQQIQDNPNGHWVPRVKLFGGKAAPNYVAAKLCIHLANDVAQMVNNDPSIKGLLKVVFVPNYNVSTAELMIPAADLSEQISTAGMEASGTGNMKLALNAALTIGTLDGANVEIKERVGNDNIFIFGLTTDEVAAKRSGAYNPRTPIERSPWLARALEAISSGHFSPSDPNRYKGLVTGIYDHDWFMVAADFDAYYATQREIDGVWQDSSGWYARAIRNTANMGWFSSDRTIKEYANEIWGIRA
ncbi:MAG TPA: glycogen/starch/alpha-glucan phosphorylase [Chthoniobacterales bacterium]